ncbi:hypothetical protein FNU79_12075 [Deinococcus detaillensis]|uniref:Uncharacterized protein n=1 Tax=Deinococcus detaillensis TaxID=2592048 RepID=A0A553UU59_9DEIO|nr:hypothetical protein FNU79_12075 [Deinococcus detaillensis]
MAAAQRGQRLGAGLAGDHLAEHRPRRAGHVGRLGGGSGRVGRLDRHFGGPDFHGLRVDAGGTARRARVPQYALGDVAAQPVKLG